MNLVELCDRSIPQVHPHEIISHFEDQLLRNNYLVVSEKDDFLGLLNRDDILPDPYKQAQDCVTEKPRISASQTLEEALDLMKNGKYSYLPVFDKQRFIGVLSYRSLIDAVFQEHQELKEELYKLEKYEVMDNTLAGFVHDFNNILMVIQSNLTLLQLKGYQDKNLTDSTQAVQTGITKAVQLMKRLTREDRLKDIQKEVVDISQFLSENTRYYTRINKNVRYTIDIAPGLCPVELDPVRFSQAYSNLIVNACQAMPDGGRLEIQAQNFSLNKDIPHVQLLPGDYVYISVQDSGPGIDAEHLPLLFTPYYTTKPTGNGLGLTVCREIVEGHQGSITVSSEPGKGACFNIFLPAYSV